MKGKIKLGAWVREAVAKLREQVGTITDADLDRVAADLAKRVDDALRFSGPVGLIAEQVDGPLARLVIRALLEEAVDAADEGR